MSKHNISIAVSALLLAAACARTDKPAEQAATTSAPSPRWAEIDRLPDFWRSTWQGVSPMTDPPMQINYTPQAQAYIAKYKPVSDIRSAEAGCKSPGMPFVMQIAALPIKFMIEPGMVSIYIEGHSQTRFIHMNREHRDSVIPSYLGDSVGKWEGDTLVIDTVGFVDDTTFQYGTREMKPEDGDNFIRGVIFGPHGPNLRMVERVRLTDPNTLEIKNTVYDDTVFASPIETIRVWKRKTGEGAEPMEFVCTDSFESYDPATDKHVVVDPAEVLKRK